MAEFEIVVIGGGAAGLTVAVGGARLGLHVALVERARLGGECTWTGCVPSKALLHVAGIAAAARLAAAWSAGGPSPPTVDFAAAMAHVRRARQEIASTESARVLRRHGVTVYEGTARVRRGAKGGRPGVVEVDGRPITTRHIVLATGSEAAIPPVPGLAETHYLTNETLFDALDTLPARFAIVGGGPIGVEMAQAFARLGSTVTLFQSGPRLLPRDDPAASAAVRAILERDGVIVRTGSKLTLAVPAPDGGRGATLSAAGSDDVVADAVLVAAGRRARTAGMGLEEVGIELGRDGVEMDAYLHTSVPGVWATGDVVGPYRFTHMADIQGRAVLRNIIFPWRQRKMDYRVVPWATFTDPEVGHVGLTEEQARNAHGTKVSVVLFPLSRVDRAITEGATEGFIKLVLRGETILGAQIVAPRAAELVQEVALAMHRRLPVGALSMVHIYPSYAYGLHQAADEAWRTHAKGGLLDHAALPLLRRLALR